MVNLRPSRKFLKCLTDKKIARSSLSKALYLDSAFENLREKNSIGYEMLLSV